MGISSYDEHNANNNLFMLTCIDIETLYKEKRGSALDYIMKLSTISHTNLISIHKWWYIQDKIIFVETEAPLNTTIYNMQ